MPPAVYLALLLSFLPAVILAEPLHLPLARRAPSQLNLGDLANNLRIKYGYQPVIPRSSRRAAVAGIGVKVQGLDSSYVAEARVGTPPQVFNLILDTGSSDLWLAGSNCVSCPAGVPTFDTSTSTTFGKATTTLSNGPVIITYGSGKVSGTLGQDVVSMGGFEISNQIFVSVSQIEGNVTQGDVAGLIGLAFVGIANSGAVPFWQALVNNNQLTSPIMSFWLARNPNPVSQTSLAFGGVFTLGGTNTTLFSGDIDFVNVIQSTTPSFWLLPLSSITVNGAAVTLPTTGATCAIDTGTTLIGGPTADVVALYKAIPGSVNLGNSDPGFFAFPCSSNVTVAMSFGGKLWPINSQDLIIGQVSRQLCVGGIFDLRAGSSIGSNEGNPDWVVGDTFLKGVYSVFRATPPSVGFAELSTAAGGSGTSSGSTPSTTRSAALSTAIPAFLMLSTAFTATIMLCL